MKTTAFLNLLNEHKDKCLLFEYATNLLVGANYHITEVKHVTIDSVDCGAGTDFWKETIIQLWESPEELGKTEYMRVQKALEILNRVGKIKKYNAKADVKIEYSNATFNTAQLHVYDYELRENNLIIKLAIASTDCKAKETCGITATIVNEETPNCAPGSGCC